MRRRFFTIVSAAALLLGVLMIAIMVLSDWPMGRCHFLGDRGWHHQWFIEIDSDGISLCRWPVYLFTVRSSIWILLLILIPSFSVWAWEMRLFKAVPLFRIERPRSGEIDISGRGIVYAISVATGFCLFNNESSSVFLIAVSSFVLAALLTIPRRIAERRQHMLESGYCPTCGYDLRASQGRCPECGRAL